VVKIGISTPRPKKLAAFFMRRELTAKDAKSAKKSQALKDFIHLECAFLGTLPFS
jgi:hypothetical protein